MSKGFLETVIGILEITAENGKIVRIDLVTGKAESDCVEICRSTADEDAINETKKQLYEYFSGLRKEFSLDIELRGTDFQKSVWNVLQTIPYGKTMSYAEVAAAAGKPAGQRAAGNAVGKNPLLIVVPCHRVIRTDGSIGGFSSGIDAKIILQKTEGIL